MQLASLGGGKRGGKGGFSLFISERGLPCHSPSIHPSTTFLYTRLCLYVENFVALLFCVSTSWRPTNETPSRLSGSSRESSDSLDLAPCPSLFFYCSPSCRHCHLALWHTTFSAHELGVSVTYSSFHFLPFFSSFPQTPHTMSRLYSWQHIDRGEPVGSDLMIRWIIYTMCVSILLTRERCWQCLSLPDN
jgi:hypothetical protein